MNSHIFVINKDKSLAIMKSIFDKITNTNQICINENMDESRMWYDEDDEDSHEIIIYKHKLAIAEIFGEFNESLHIEEQQDIFFPVLEAITKETKGQFQKLPPLEQYMTNICRRSDQIEIMEGGGKIIDNNIITLTAYVHESSMECDVSYFNNFKYSDVYNCWILMDPPTGIDCYGSGGVIILDFSDYNKDTLDR